MALQGRTPTKDEQAWLDKISQLGCVVCRAYLHVYTPASPHHIEGKTKPGAHKKTIPLCHNHHQEGSDCATHTSRHPHKAAFEKRYGTEQQLLEFTQSLVKMGVVFV